MTAIAGFLGDAWSAVLVHLWQTTVILIPIILMSRWMRSAPARWIYLLWSAALLKIFLPVALLGRLAAGVVTRLFGGMPGAGSSSAAALKAVSAVWDPTGTLSLGGALSREALAAALIVATGLWLAGVLWSLSRIVRDQFAARDSATAGGSAALFLDALPQTPRARLHEAIQGTEIPRDALRVTSAAIVPCAVGLLRPRILVPRALIEALAAEDLRAVLLHEESHRRRRDPLRNLIQRVCAAPLFFYPVLGWLLRRLQQSAEMICDEAVLRAGVAADAYSGALARTVRLGLAPAAPSMAGGLGGGSTIRLRLERLAAPGRFLTMPRHVVILALALLLVAAGSFLPLTPAAGGGDKAAPPGDKTERTPDTFIAYDTPPSPITMVQPKYPEQEREDGVEGMVMLRMEVKKDGTVGELFVAQGVEDHPAFGESAMEAAKQWRFEPAKVGKKPVACWVQVPVKFALDEKK